MELIRFVGERIKELRNQAGGKGMSQEDLASKVDTTANTISRWETGAYKPSIEDLAQLSRVFGVSILEFFPKEQASTNEPIAALLRAARDLPESDVEELRRYAEFRRARSLYEGRKKRGLGRPKIEPR
jgi:transcriptional regulator with XRE-family HTH domain